MLILVLTLLILDHEKLRRLTGESTINTHD